MMFLRRLQWRAQRGQGAGDQQRHLWPRVSQLASAKYVALRRLRARVQAPAEEEAMSKRKPKRIVCHVYKRRRLAISAIGKP
jgi:hypothetical protein